jgi:shikimate dehydrogenase
MEPQLDSLPIDMIDGLNNLDFITENTTVVDMIYNPNQTRFLYEAKKRGAKTFNGLGMLIYQGIIAYELFTGVKLPDNMADLIKEEVFSLK